MKKNRKAKGKKQKEEIKELEKKKQEVKAASNGLTSHEHKLVEHQSSPQFEKIETGKKIKMEAKGKKKSSKAEDCEKRVGNIEQFVTTGLEEEMSQTERIETEGLEEMSQTKQTERIETEGKEETKEDNLKVFDKERDVSQVPCVLVRTTRDVTSTCLDDDVHKNVNNQIDISTGALLLLLDQQQQQLSVKKDQTLDLYNNGETKFGRRTTLKRSSIYQEINDGVSLMPNNNGRHLLEKNERKYSNEFETLGLQQQMLRPGAAACDWRRAATAAAAAVTKQVSVKKHTDQDGQILQLLNGENDCLYLLIALV